MSQELFLRLLRVRPGSQFTLPVQVEEPDGTLREPTLDDVVWLDGTLPPTEAEVAAFEDDVWRDAFWADAKAKREVYLNRLMGIAGRYARRQPEGWEQIVEAADNFSEGLLALHNHPSVQVDATPTQQSLKVAFLTQYWALVAAAMATAPGSKAIWDGIAK